MLANRPFNHQPGSYAPRKATSKYEADGHYGANEIGGPSAFYIAENDPPHEAQHEAIDQHKQHSIRCGHQCKAQKSQPGDSYQQNRCLKPARSL